MKNPPLALIPINRAQKAHLSAHGEVCYPYILQPEQLLVFSFNGSTQTYHYRLPSHYIIWFVYQRPLWKAIFCLISHYHALHTEGIRHIWISEEMNDTDSTFQDTSQSSDHCGFLLFPFLAYMFTLCHLRNERS